MDELDKIKRWLYSIDKDRIWLAEQCGVSKRTVDGWFSQDRKMPKLAKECIRRIMQDTTFSELRMNYDEWGILNQGMQESGYRRFNDFVMDILKTQVAENQKKYGKNKDSNSPPPRKKNDEDTG